MHCIHGTHYVPQLSKNLLSVNAITETNGEVKFIEHKVEIWKDEKMFWKAIKRRKDCMK